MRGFGETLRNLPAVGPFYRGMLPVSGIGSIDGQFGRLLDFVTGGAGCAGRVLLIDRGCDLFFNMRGSRLFLFFSRELQDV